MSNHSKEYNNIDEMLIASQTMRNYQLMHNAIRNDYIVLLEITGKSQENQKSFDALYRACIISMFSLVESDIYGLNVLDPYPNYSDKHDFTSKLEKTFKQISRTWEKEEIKQQYFYSCKPQLKVLKRMRDEIIHPKEISHIHIATETKFKELKAVFNDYDSFINDLMNNFFLSTKINLFK
ncbi:hypothetical protein EZ456_09480 [Pedobacter psychrodurus]|uniref:RiboL-PSP-HEPN domain-containing protein n=1 Tax=Pedobacter psychrodurus TaxID=2530456 RepID=A0A4R0Q7E6_9SPHI|nr:hypothetical protein [Pedobacter psychrodurus]TCD27417.1 hypothetical protein EZ456_09480 [Pedobacter psychrodurus]